MKEIFNKLYSELIARKTNWSNESETQFKSHLLESVVKGKTVILLGCGDFSFGTHLLDKVKMIQGVDFSSIAISTAKNRSLSDEDSKKIYLNVADLKNEDIDFGKFDVVVDDYVSHCIVDQRSQYFKNVRSAMNENSLFVTLAITWPDGFQWPDFVAATIDPLTKTQIINGVVGRVFKSPDELLAELAGEGFVTEFSKVIENPSGQPIFFSLNSLKK